MLPDAVVMGDSHGFDERAAKILNDALERERRYRLRGRHGRGAGLSRTSLADQTGDNAAAAEAINRNPRAIPLTDAEREGVAEALVNLDDLSAVVVPAPRT